MDPITQQTVLAAAGAAGGDPVYVDDVFSTYLYTGNGQVRTIANGIDLAGEGGLVWIKNNQLANGWAVHLLFDTERSPTNSDNMYYLMSASTNGQAGTNSNTNQDFGGWASNGFNLGVPNSMGSDAVNDGEATKYVSWTFRKQKGFFDIVTYTGTDSTQNTQTIAHSLGSVPGMIIVKRTSGSQSWYVYHRSIGNDKHLVLDNYNAQTGSAAWNDTTPTSTHFTVSGGDVNANGQTHVAYIFAHDDASFGTDGDESIIKCGSYVGNGGTKEVDVGFEPQWFMIKSSSEGGTDWSIYDVMRGADQSGGNMPRLQANNDEEDISNLRVQATNSGFKIVSETSYDVNYNNKDYIYMAIRRPNKPPEVATDVFAISTRLQRTTAGSSYPRAVSNFPVDAVIRRNDINSTGNPYLASRLTGAAINTDQNNAEWIQGHLFFASNIGLSTGSGAAETDDYYWMFKRAPGFMDVVTYVGDNSSNRQINHELGVAPELIIIKNRNNGSVSWPVWSKYATFNSSEHRHGFLNSTSDFNNYGGFSNQVDQSSLFTSSIFSVRTSSNYTNGSGQNYIAHLFASLPGISKVGSYTGSSGAVNVDCGFTNGARFVMVKKMSGSGDWVLWDSVRGITSGNDPYLKLNESQAQTTNEDLIAPLSSGFTINNSGVGNVNASSQSYLFFAIA